MILTRHFTCGRVASSISAEGSHDVICQISVFGVLFKRHQNAAVSGCLSVTRFVIGINTALYRRARAVFIVANFEYREEYRMKVLLVDDDMVLSDVTRFTLRRAGFEVLVSHDGLSGYERWQIEAPDMVILESRLPGMDGLTLCRRIRAVRNTPVIMLSVRAADEDVVKGLENGADDYIIKPFSPTQLVARVRAVLRRAGKTSVSSNLSCGDLTIDVTRREVQRTGQSAGIQLTALECRLLEKLMVNAGQVLPGETLVNAVWGIDGGDRVMLKQLIRRLRQKIEPNPARPVYIETVSGVGYALMVKREDRAG
jgi:DNA-binding response OmpR family regulator